MAADWTFLSTGQAAGFHQFRHQRPPIGQIDHYALLRHTGEWYDDMNEHRVASRALCLAEISEEEAAEAPEAQAAETPEAQEWEPPKDLPPCYEKLKEENGIVEDKPPVQCPCFINEKDPTGKFRHLAALLPA